MTELFLMLYTFYVLTVAAVACVGCLVYLGMRNCGYKRLHSGAIAVCFVAIVVSLVGCGEREPRTDIPPATRYTVMLDHTKLTFYRINVAGRDCLVMYGPGPASGLDCEYPPTYGDIESAAQVARCDTDTDCMQKFGGDGSPRRVRF